MEPGVDKVEEDTVLEDDGPLRGVDVADEVDDWRGVCFELFCWLS